MYFEKQLSVCNGLWQKSSVLALLGVLALTGCGSSSSSSDNTGNLRFYNLSPNSPAIYLTIDEDLSDDDEDAFENTYSSINFTEISTSAVVDTEDYFYEVAFQDEDSKYREDLEIILEGSISIEEDTTQLMVLSDDINSPEITVYAIPTIDYSDEEDVFNLRVLNMHNSDDVAHVYFSKNDETFNEAVLVSQLAYKTLSDTQQFEQDSYVFYLTDINTNEVLYQSDDISFEFLSEYIMVIRTNTATGDSPYILDQISNANIIEYADVNTESHMRGFNAIISHDLLPAYQGNITFTLDSVTNSTSSQSFTFGEFSETLIQENSDYSLDVTIAETGENILTNHLLTLPENSDKTVFFYLTETAVDDDNDGDVDENNDGEIDEIEITVNSLVIENSTDDSIYDHEMTLVNLVDSDDFNFVRFYFVRSNELIDTTPYDELVSFGSPEQLTLLNNTYKVYIVAEDGSSDIILHTFELILDENSKAQFIVLQADNTTSSGYRVSIADQ
jgi:hypothetical protein